MSTLVESLENLVKGSGVIFIGTMAGRSLGLLGHVLVARFLSPVAFGNIAIAFTIVSVVGSLVVVGIPKGVTRQIAANRNDPKKQRSLIQGGYLVTFVGGIVGGSGLYLARDGVAALMGNPALSRLLSVFAVFLVVHPIAIITIGALRGFKMTIEPVIARDLGTKIVSVVLFGIALLTGRLYTGAIVYWLSIPFSMTLVGMYYLNKTVSLRSILLGRLDTDSVVELSSYSWPLAFETGFVLLMSNLDLLMVGFFLAPADVGSYKAVQPLATISLVFLHSITFLYIPIATERFEQRDYEGLTSLYDASTKWVASATAPLVLTFTLFPHHVVRTVIAPKYVDAGFTFAILSVGMFLRAVIGPNGATIKAIDRTKVNLFSSASGLLVNVTLNITLIPVWGIVGGAVATMAGFAVFNLIELAAIYRFTGMFPLSRNVVKPLVVTTAAGGGLAQFLAGWTLSLGQLLAIGAALSMLQLLSMVVTGAFDENDIRLLRAGGDAVGFDIDPIVRLLE